MKKAGIIGGILVILAVIAALGYWQFGNKASADTITLDDAKVKAITFINDNLMQPGSQVTLKDAVDEGGLYKITVNMPTGQEVESYITKDGKTFFPQGMDIAQYAQANQTQTDDTAQATPANVPKSDKPSIELFVMSHCPYGTQMEKGILPVLAQLGDSVDFQLKFCDYSMHGDKELVEELNQYCIEQDYPDKLTDYLSCFLADETGGQTCMQQNGIDTAKIASCAAAADKQYKVTENAANNVGYRGSYPGFTIFQADTDKYGVSGSPTLVIDGQQVSSGRSPSALLATICSAFNNQPDACTASLPSDTPSAGFGYGTNASDASAAQCGS